MLLLGWLAAPGLVCSLIRSNIAHFALRIVFRWIAIGNRDLLGDSLDDFAFGGRLRLLGRRWWLCKHRLRCFGRGLDLGLWFLSLFRWGS